MPKQARGEIRYITFARMPTEKAHGLAIARSCESFARAGANVMLVVPKRRTNVAGDLFSAYGVERIFRVREIGVPDLIGMFPNSAFAFWLQYTLFMAVVVLQLSWSSRKTVLYSRDSQTMLCSLLGYRVIYECHHMFNKSGFFFWLCRRAYRIVTISGSLKQIFVEHGFSEERIFVAPSGVDPSLFGKMTMKEARALLGLPAHVRIALYTGHLYDWKGAATLAKASNSLPNGTVAVFVGGVEKDIEAFNKEFRANTHIRVVGNRPHSEIPQWLAAADVLVLPNSGTSDISRLYTSPLKLFEYMAAERPIVASDLPSIREILSDDTAYFVRANDPEDLARGIREALDSREASQSHARLAREKVGQYTWDSRANAILAFMYRG